MTASLSTRLQIYTWTSGDDPFTRDQMATSHNALETRGAVFLPSGTLAARPAAGPTNARGFYLATDQNSPNGILYYSDGTTWVAINAFATPGAITPGDSAAAGSASTLARSDHQHSIPGYATTTAAVSTSASGGSASTFARGDHVHILADNSVTAGKIASGGVSTASQLASDVVTTAKILNENVTRAKIAASERIPVGMISPYGGATAPTGWMLCDGSEVLASSELGTLLGSRYNTGGETAGYVRVPDLNGGRFPYGATSGNQGGASTVSLVVGNLPNHQHSVGTLDVSGDGSHSHSASGTTGLANQNHTHTFAHTHSVSATNGNPPVVSAGLFGTWWAPSDGDPTGSHNISSSSGGNTVASSSYWNTSLATSSQSASTTDGHSVNHDHSFSWSLSGQGGHNHDISGNTGNMTSGGSGSSFSIIPPYVAVTYIIKT